MNLEDINKRYLIVTDPKSCFARRKIRSCIISFNVGLTKYIIFENSQVRN